MWQLVINGPGYFDTAYDLLGGVTQLGRADDNEIVLSGDSVSRKHARLHVKGNALLLEDLGSRNGCKVNGKRVKGTLEVRPGDEVTLGENTLTVRLPTVAEKAPTEVVDLGQHSGLKRFGRGSDVSKAVVSARDVSSPRAPLPSPPVETSGKRRRSQGPSTDEIEVVPTELHAVAGGMADPTLVLMASLLGRLNAAQSLQGFLDDVTDAVMRRVGAHTGVVLVRHPTGALVPGAVRHATALKRGEVPVSDAVVDTALEQGRALAVANVGDDARFAKRDSVLLYGVHQVLCIPVGHQAPFDGVLYLNRTSVADEPAERLLQVSAAMAQVVLAGILKFRTAATEDSRLRNQLQRFYSPPVADRRLAELKSTRGALSQLSPQQVTVLHLGLDGSGGALAKLAVDRAADLMATFHRVVREVVFNFDGAVDSTAGDSARAAFGTPYAASDDALRAVRAALRVKAEWTKTLTGRPARERVAVCAGLATGPVRSGLIGDEAHLSAVTLGEAVQRAAGLLHLAEGGQVLLAGGDAAGLGGTFGIAPAGERQLFNGKDKVQLFEVLGELRPA